MFARYLKPFTAALLSIFCWWSTPAMACTITASPPPAQLGTYGSLALIDGLIYTVSSTTGIRCSTLLEVVSNSYLALQIEGSIPPLKREGGTETIPLIVSWTQNGTPLTPNTMLTDYSTTIFGLLKSSGGDIPLHYRTVATAAVIPGIYEADLTLRWFYSVCLVGVGSLCVPANSPGFTRDGCIIFTDICLGERTSWGTGRAVNVKIRLVVERDCKINAPPVTFGSRPLPDTFPIISQTVTVRCGVGPAYQVALDNGQNDVGNTRRMRVPATNLYLEYDIFKGTAGQSRWGSSGTEMLSSSLAEGGTGITDGLATQSYSYRAQIRAAQPQTPVVGNYKDTLRLSVIF